MTFQDSRIQDYAILLYFNIVTHFNLVTFIVIMDNFSEEDKSKGNMQNTFRGNFDYFQLT